MRTEEEKISIKKVLMAGNKMVGFEELQHYSDVAEKNFGGFVD